MINESQCTDGCTTTCRCASIHCMYAPIYVCTYTSECMHACTATHCNTLLHTLYMYACTHVSQSKHIQPYRQIAKHTATHCNVLQRTATHCVWMCQVSSKDIPIDKSPNILQRTATQCNALSMSMDM